MNERVAGDLAARAAELRSEFDRSFAVAEGSAEPVEAFLAIDAGSGRYALRLAEISAVHAGRKVLRLPESPAELLGIAAFRGTLIPVYDLRVLLGYAGAAAAARWLVLTAAEPVVGLVFDHLEGHLRMPRTAIAQDDRPERRSEHVRETLAAADGLRPIVSLQSMMDSIKKRAQARAPQGGR